MPVRSFDLNMQSFAPRAKSSQGRIETNAPMVTMGGKSKFKKGNKKPTHPGVHKGGAEHGKGNAKAHAQHAAGHSNEHSKPVHNASHVNLVRQGVTENHLHHNYGHNVTEHHVYNGTHTPMNYIMSLIRDRFEMEKIDKRFQLSPHHIKQSRDLYGKTTGHFYEHHFEEIRLSLASKIAAHTMTKCIGILQKARFNEIRASVWGGLAAHNRSELDDSGRELNFTTNLKNNIQQKIAREFVDTTKGLTLNDKLELETDEAKLHEYWKSSYQTLLQGSVFHAARQTRTFNAVLEMLNVAYLSHGCHGKNDHEAFDDWVKENDDFIGKYLKPACEKTEDEVQHDKCDHDMRKHVRMDAVGQCMYDLAITEYCRLHNLVLKFIATVGKYTFTSHATNNMLHTYNHAMMSLLHDKHWEKAETMEKLFTALAQIYDCVSKWEPNVRVQWDETLNLKAGDDMDVMGTKSTITLYKALGQLAASGDTHGTGSTFMSMLLHGIVPDLMQKMPNLKLPNETHCDAQKQEQMQHKYDKFTKALVANLDFAGFFAETKMKNNIILTNPKEVMQLIKAFAVPNNDRGGFNQEQASIIAFAYGAFSWPVKTRFPVDNVDLKLLGFSTAQTHLTRANTGIASLDVQKTADKMLNAAKALHVKKALDRAVRAANLYNDQEKLEFYQATKAEFAAKSKEITYGSVWFTMMKELYGKPNLTQSYYIGKFSTEAYKTYLQKINFKGINATLNRIPSAFNAINIATMGGGPPQQPPPQQQPPLWNPSTDEQARNEGALALLAAEQAKLEAVTVRFEAQEKVYAGFVNQYQLAVNQNKEHTELADIAKNAFEAGRIAYVTAKTYGDEVPYVTMKAVAYAHAANVADGLQEMAQAAHDQNKAGGYQGIVLDVWKRNVNEAKEAKESMDALSQMFNLQVQNGGQDVDMAEAKKRARDDDDGGAAGGLGTASSLKFGVQEHIAGDEPTKDSVDVVGTKIAHIQCTQYFSRMKFVKDRASLLTYYKQHQYSIAKKTNEFNEDASLMGDCNLTPACTD